MAQVGPGFSKDDFKEYVLPAWKEKTAEVKSYAQIAKATIADDIRAEDKKLLNDNALLERIKRKFAQEWKARPDMTAAEALAFYRKLTGLEILHDSWIPYKDVTVRGVDRMELEEKGYRYNPDTRSWESRAPRGE